MNNQYMSYSINKKNTGQKLFTILSLLIIGLYTTVSVQGSTYYVSLNGDDSNAGSEVQPWRTIQKAAETLIAGDVVFIKSGIYEESITVQNSGNIDNYILYTAYPGDEVTIDCQNVPLPDWESGIFTLEDVSYIEIKRLTIKNAGPNPNNSGIYVDGCSNIIIEDNYVYNTVSSGIGIWNSADITIASNEVELACNDGEQECITVAVTDGFEIIYNHIHDGGPGTNGGEGIDVKDGSRNGIVRGNYLHDIQSERTGIYLESWDKHTYNIEVFQNLVHDCGAGISLASEMGGLLEGVNIYNNIVYNNRSNGLEIGNWGVVGVESRPIKNIKFINNTAYKNGSDVWGAGIYIENPDAIDIVVRNNIFSQNVIAQIAHEVDAVGQNIVVDHNLIDGFRGELDEEIYGNDYIEEDAGFFNTSAADFHLTENSPAINSGSSEDAPEKDFDNNLRPFGDEYDIGAYEYGYPTSIEEELFAPENFSLSQNYPNPFNPTTIIKYEIPSFKSPLHRRGFRGGLLPVKLIVYDMLGREIATLVNERQRAGRYDVNWDATDLPSGVYIYNLTAGDYLDSKKMLLLK